MNNYSLRNLKKKTNNLTVLKCFVRHNNMFSVKGNPAMAILCLKYHEKALISNRDIVGIFCFNDCWLIIIWSSWILLFQQIGNSAPGYQTPYSWCCTNECALKITGSDSKCQRQTRAIVAACFANYPRGFSCRRNPQFVIAPQHNCTNSCVRAMGKAQRKGFNSEISCYFCTRSEDGHKPACTWEMYTAHTPHSSACICAVWGTSQVAQPERSRAVVLKHLVGAVLCNCHSFL